MEAPLRFSLETRRRKVQLSESVALIAAPSTNLGTASHARLYRGVSPTPQELLRPELIGTRAFPSFTSTDSALL